MQNVTNRAFSASSPNSASLIAVVMAVLYCNFNNAIIESKNVVPNDRLNSKNQFSKVKLSMPAQASFKLERKLFSFG
jgi:hypothetical protein